MLPLVESTYFISQVYVSGPAHNSRIRTARNVSLLHAALLGCLTSGHPLA